MESTVGGRKKPRQLLVGLLRACAKQKDLCHGIRIHATILKKGLLEKSSYVARTLVSMYAKCGAIAKAEELLDGVPAREVFTWNAVIAGYSHYARGDDALNCLERMQLDGFSPDEVTFACILKACGNIRALEKGEEIHDEIVRQGLLGKDVILGTALVGMYVKCGALSKAQAVFDGLLARDSFAWNTLIEGYVQQGQAEDALDCFEQMQRDGISPDVVTFTSILKACGSSGLVYKGEQIHDEIVHQGLLGKDIVLDNALVDMYAKCNALEKARQVLEELPTRTKASWNSLIAGYSQYGKGKDALDCFEQMQHEGIYPDELTFICILKACGSIGAIEMGGEIHNEIHGQGLLGKSVVLGTTLVDMYAKCGALAKAQQVLEELPVRDVVAWNALLVGYAQQGQGQDIFYIYKRMRVDGILPDEVTFTCILKACSSLGEVEKGEQIYNEIVKQGLLQDNIVLVTALVDMYAKCGALVKAQQVLDKLLPGNAATWNAMLAGYIQQGQGEDALNCFEQMLRMGISPDDITFTCVLKACGILGAADKGEQIHDEIVQEGLLAKSFVLCTALVDMYAKCGALAKALEGFKQLVVPNVVSWNTLLAGYAQQGMGHDALICFERMQCTGCLPDAGTFSCLLNACSHSGLVEEGQMYFIIMNMDFGIMPDVDHYTCIIDLFGRAGLFNEAAEVTQQIPLSDFPAVWSALLGACQKWGDVNAARWAFEHTVQMDQSDVAAYVCMSNIYAAANIEEDAEHIKAFRMKDKLQEGGRNR